MFWAGEDHVRKPHRNHQALCRTQRHLCSPTCIRAALPNPQRAAFWAQQPGAKRHRASDTVPIQSTQPSKLCPARDGCTPPIPPYGTSKPKRTQTTNTGRPIPSRTLPWRRARQACTSAAGATGFLPTRAPSAATRRSTSIHSLARSQAAMSFPRGKTR